MNKRKTVLQKVSSSRAVFRSLLDATPQLLYLVDFDGHILALNRRGAGALGSTPEYIAGRSGSLFVDWDLFEYLMDRIENVLCSKKILRFEKRIADTHFDVHISPVFDNSKKVFRAVLILSNMSELKKTGEELRESRQRLMSVIDAMPVIIHAHDEQGNFIFWNKESERVLGYTPEQILNNPRAFEMLYPDEELRKRARIVWKEHEGKGPCEIQIVTRYGEKKLIEWTRLSRDYPIPGWAEWEMGVDVTDRRAFEKELARARDEAENANQVKSRFLANISHEMRTPLSGIIGLSSLVLESSLEQEQKRNLQGIAQLSEHLLQTINEILDFSKIENGRFSPEKHDFDLNAVLENVHDAFFHQTRDKDIDLVITSELNIPVFLRGDEYSLKRVLFNLVANAVRFTDSGKVELSVSLIETRQDQALLLFVVSDTGVGIPVEMREKIFEPFSQVEEGFSRKYGGTGLGLAICKSLVELMRGEIWMESLPGKGSRFFFKARFELVLPSSESPHQTEQSRVPAISPLNILLVEDFEVNQVVLAHMLKKMGHTVEIRSNGKEALLALEQGASRFDLVLMDIQMPVMNGFEATKQIRAHTDPAIASIPVIALTAHTLGKNIKYSMEAGMNGYILKPLKYQDLQKAIEDALKRV